MADLFHPSVEANMCLPGQTDLFHQPTMHPSSDGHCTFSGAMNACHDGIWPGAAAGAVSGAAAGAAVAAGTGGAAIPAIALGAAGGAAVEALSHCAEEMTKYFTHGCGP